MRAKVLIKFLILLRTKLKVLNHKIQVVNKLLKRSQTLALLFVFYRSNEICIALKYYDIFVE